MRIIKCDCDCESDPCEDCNPGEVSCLDFFNIQVTLPGETWDDLSGVYQMNRTGYPQSLSSDIWWSNLCSTTCNAFGFMGEDFAISIQADSHPYVWDFIWRGFVYLRNPSGSWNQFGYGLNFSQGGFQMVDQGSCEGHCNGLFSGKYAQQYMPKTKDLERQGIFINGEPGEFIIPMDKTWGAQGFFDGECGQCHSENHTYYPGLNVSFNFKEKFFIRDDLGRILPETYILQNNIFKQLENGCTT